MKITFVLLLTLLIPNLACAKKPIRELSPFNKYEKGQSITYQSNQYVHLPGLGAQREPSPVSPQSPQDQTESNNILLVKEGFVVRQNENSAQSSLSAQSPDIYPVVLNPRSQKIGIVVGTLVAIMENLEFADQLVADYNLSQANKYPIAKTVIFKASYPSQVLEIIDQFRTESAITYVEIEVLESTPRPL